MENDAFHCVAIENREKIVQVSGMIDGNSIQQQKVFIITPTVYLKIIA